VGRLSPDYIVNDGVVPQPAGRGLGEIERMSERYGLQVANVFRAGDGNSIRDHVTGARAGRLRASRGAGG
jgi:glycolate oxidase